MQFRQAASKRGRSAFTLIELLIVVAIIAILAAIAVPNFLEAQVRAKVSRVKTDQRSLATAIEAYAVDWNTNIGTRDIMDLMSLAQPEARIVAYSMLTTPVAFMTTIPPDPFVRGSQQVGRTREEFQYQTSHEWSKIRWNLPVRRGYTWGLNSWGPMFERNGPTFRNTLAVKNPGDECYLYDPTNGTMSEGFLIRTNKGIMSQPDLAPSVWE
jgi:prepilin-type N-terminal cleavage/methylation domain-containing protein